MIASTQVLASMQDFVQLLAKLRAILRADSRNSLRSTATTSFALLPSKQSVDGSNTSRALEKSTPSKVEGLAAADPHSNPLTGNKRQARRALVT